MEGGIETPAQKAGSEERVLYLITLSMFTEHNGRHVYPQVDDRLNKYSLFRLNLEVAMTRQIFQGEILQLSIQRTERRNVNVVLRTRLDAFVC